MTPIFIKMLVNGDAVITLTKHIVDPTNSSRVYAFLNQFPPDRTSGSIIGSLLDVKEGTQSNFLGLKGAFDLNNQKLQSPFGWFSFEISKLIVV